MLPSPERNERSKQLSSAPIALVEPVRRLVRFADALIDNYGVQLTGHKVGLFVMHPETDRFYEISRVTSPSAASRDKNATGLFISGYQVAEEKMTERLVPIQTPKRPESVTRDTIYHLRGLDPKDVERLTEELGSDKLRFVSQEDYMEVVSEMKGR